MIKERSCYKHNITCFIFIVDKKTKTIIGDLPLASSTFGLALPPLAYPPSNNLISLVFHV